MSTLTKLAVIFAIATIAIAAQQALSPRDYKASTASSMPRASISPEALTRDAGPMTETQIDHYH